MLCAAVNQVKLPKVVEFNAIFYSTEYYLVQHEQIERTSWLKVELIIGICACIFKTNEVDCIAVKEDKFRLTRCV